MAIIVYLMLLVFRCSSGLELFYAIHRVSHHALRGEERRGDTCGDNNLSHIIVNDIL